MTKVTNWNTVWLIMTVLSVILMLTFGALFRDDVTKKAAAASTN